MASTKSGMLPASRARVGAADFFSPFLQEIAAAEAADPEPEPRFSAAWNAWQSRHCRREADRTELREAEAITTALEDPAPLCSEGLREFLKWSVRQDQRRKFRL